MRRRTGRRRGEKREGEQEISREGVSMTLSDERSFFSGTISLASVSVEIRSASASARCTGTVRSAPVSAGFVAARRARCKTLKPVAASTKETYSTRA